METIKTMTHEATSSWNGYSYQGKAAVYVALDILNKNNLDSSTCQTYALEIEWTEDFSIKNGGICESIHQVKTYKANNIGAYKNALWTLLGKTTMDTTIKKSFLHTTEKIPSETTMESDLIGLGAPTSSKCTKNYTTLDYYNEVNKRGNYNKAFGILKKYVYDSGDDYCPLNSITEQIKGQMKKFYSLRKISRTPLHIDRAFLYLLAKVDEHVNERHIAIQKGDNSNKVIPFETLYEILVDNFEESSEDFYCHYLREVFHRHCEEYLYKNEHDSNKDEYQKLSRVLLSIQSLDDKSFVKICKKWTPHVQANQLNLMAFRKLIPDQGIENPLLRIFYKINAEVHDGDFVFQKLNSDKDHIVYLPTAIFEFPTLDDDETLDESEISSIAKRILNNSDIDDLHEVDVMISLRIPMSSLKEAADKHTKSYDIDEENKDHSKITKIKNVKMLTFQMAKKELES
ncbi:ABC-three component system protein [Paenibacillus polymyxa]|uniref:ABC-three component system protein n=1 Tax=Paenibacillus polymyxa TaxID=1406 RepID=UPI002AB3FEE4|nr:ABC-three component system protein [Paenibacillus polymyxa]MDY8024972.1 ABC-three component system protein [Paenibacillus polymyxa]